MTVTMTKLEWKKTHRDFKGIVDGQRMVLRNDPKTGGTVLVPVKIEEKLEPSESEMVEQSAHFAADV